MVKYWCVKARKDMGNSVGAGNSRPSLKRQSGSIPVFSINFIKNSS